MRIVIALLLASILCACHARQEADGAVHNAAAGAAGAARAFLALEHRLELDAPDTRIAPIFDATKAACARVPKRGCTVLDATISSGEHPSAKVKMRATPQGVRAVMAAVAPQGKLVEQSSTAEDLAKPIEDGARKLAMLRTYRSKLETLAQAPGVDTDALIKLNRELVEVQNELETAAGTQAHLTLRVQTEVLTVMVSEISTAAFSKPIREAFSEFLSNLSKGIALAISSVAFLLPAAVLLFALVAAWRALRRRWTRKQAMRSAAPS